MKCLLSFTVSSSENLFSDMADRLSEDGWRELGYVYVNIDDCWASMDRDSQGQLQADPKRYGVCVHMRRHTQAQKPCKHKSVSQ